MEQPTPNVQEVPSSVSEDDVQALLQKECELWQQKLRLQDWNVEVRLCRLNQLPEDSIACIQHYTERKDAVLKVLSPMDIPLVKDEFLGTEAANYDLSLVHELLHLHLIPLSDYSNESRRMAEEQIVNTLSRTIVHAYEQIPKPETQLLSKTLETTLSTGHYL